MKLSLLDVHAAFDRVVMGFGYYRGNLMPYPANARITRDGVVRFIR